MPSSPVDWQSSAIPPTIRRPWRVFEEDVEDKIADAAQEGRDADEPTRASLAALQARGAHAAFLEQPEDVQRTYAEVSLMELSAYVSWQRVQAQRAGGAGTAAPTEFEAAWDNLDCDDKAEWVPEDPRAVLSMDPAWAPLLADGPPLCGAKPSGAKAPALKTEPAPSESGHPPLKKEPVTEGRSGTGATGAGMPATAPPAAPPPATDGPKAAAEAPAEKAPPAAEGTAARRRAPEPKAPRSPPTLRPRPRPAPAPAATTPPRGRRPMRSCRTDAEAPTESAATGTTGIMTRRRSRNHQDQLSHRGVALDRDQALVAVVPSSLEAVPTRPGGLARPLVGVANLCPEAMTAKCCVCNSDEADDTNDLGICDRCDRAFHQRCHDPPVRFFGRPEEQWFCAPCAAALARERGLTHSRGDFVWARVPADAAPWPARLLHVDFASATDTRPYWVQFFDSGPSLGSWVSESQVLPWSSGPALADVRDSKRRLAVRLAEADGAPSTRGGQGSAAMEPKPLEQAISEAEQPRSRQAASGGGGAAGGGVLVARGGTGVATSSARGTKRRRTSAAPEMEDEDEEPAAGAGADTSILSKVDEMRNLIMEARERHRWLEDQIKESCSQAGA
eukprot:TRINITY_DN24883_c0_g1_i1.p1 TRINITY_DN24883_c0_g1~~TRINITY_DN24883_c0_g1_i1.p1  ORF type:complete len:661 (-),score=131.49 TRINITY_DN24883_c0_g1_i1:184-2037(-)